MHGDVRVGQHPVGHGATGPQAAAPHDQVHPAAVLGEIHGLFAGGVSAPHHRQFLAPKLGRGAIADGAGTDAPAPEPLLAGQVQPVGTGAGGDDQGLGVEGLAVGLDSKGSSRKVDAISIGFHQVGAPAHGLGLHLVHQDWPQHPVWKAGEVLHVGGGHQLTARDATVLESGDQQGVEVGPGGVDGRGVPRGAGANDDKVFNGGTTCAHGLSGLSMS